MTNAVCANCGCSLRNARSLGTSGLYFPGDHGGFDIDLCEPCFFAEEEATEAAGTNDLPDRLAHYLSTIGYSQRSVERILKRIPNIGREPQTAGERACDQPMLCRWCDKVHVGGPENCGRPEAEPIKAQTAGQRGAE